MAQIKITITIEAELMSAAHAAVDAMDAKLRACGGRVVRARLTKDGKASGTVAAKYDWAATEPASLTKWCVLYTRIPTNYNNQQRLIIEAPTEEDAYKLARRHIGDEGKTLSTYHVESVKPHNPEPVVGRVLGGAL